MKKKLDKMEHLGLISKGKFDWATAIMCVPKDSPIEPFRAI